MALLSGHLLRHLNHCRHGQILWSNWTLATTGSTQLPQVGRKPLVPKASEFQHLFEEGPTENIYAGTPLKGMGQAQQGKMVEEWARRVLQAKNPQTEISDPDLGMCCNGSRRSPSMAAYDFLMDGRRVEIKSARMAWSSTERRWRVQFLCVKLPYGKRMEPAFTRESD